MNIFIIGAGAIGTYLAAVISREYDVTLVGKKEHHHKDHFKVIQKNGVLLSGFQTVMSKVLTTRELKRFQQILSFLLLQKHMMSKLCLKTSKTL